MKKTAIVLTLVLSFLGEAQAKPGIGIKARSTTALSADHKTRMIFSKAGGGSKISSIAKRDLGTYFKRGVSYQCANYVSHVVERAGGKPPASKSMARSWLKWGRPVPRATMRPGDIIVTSRGSNPAKGHILIYKGGGVAIHRSTHCNPIQEIPVAVYESRILGVRRLS